MAFNWLKSRQTKYTGYVVVYSVVIIMVLAGVNFLANRYDKSWDSTAQKQFSLSDQSVKIVKGLKNDVRVTYFGEMSSFVRARDLLDRYSSLSPKLKIDYVDPDRKPQQAKAEGYRSDSPIVVRSGDRTESAKALSEEEVTGALIRAQKTGERNVCFVSAAGEHSIEDEAGSGYSVLKQLLERDNYKARTINLGAQAVEPGKQVTIGQTPALASAEIPKDCNVIVIGGPQTAYTQPAVNAIKSYVEGGGRALVMLDDPLRLGRNEPPAENPELLKVLSDWGITANKDLVLDLSGLGQIFGLGPEVPLIAQYPSHTITQPLNRVPTAFPVARSLDTSGNATALVATPANSVAVSNVGTTGGIDTSKGKKGPLTLAAVTTVGSGENKGRVIVVGTSIWAQNSLMNSRSLGNRDLFGNMVNWLSSDEDLISIRPKVPEDRPLNINSQKMKLMFWMSVVLFPLAVVAAGIGTWWKRR